MCSKGEMDCVLFVHVCDIGGSNYNVYLSLQDGQTSLMLASSEGHSECVKDVLDKGAEVNMQDKVSAVLVGPF